MLTFVMCGDHQYTVRDVLETRTTPFEACTTILSFREFLRFDKLPVSDYIFSDFERLTDGQIAAVRDRFAALCERRPGLRALNTPEHRFRRLQVSSCLYEAGINTFRVVPAHDLPDDLRFPVFVRRLDDHNGPVTAMLNDWQALRRALAAIEADASGGSSDDLAVVEVVDTRNDDGLHEKQSYFRVGDTMFPGALNATENWVCKGVARNNEGAAMKQRRMRFLTGNEHGCAMRKVFETAGITYGRADYAMVNGRPEVFEINTNPMIVRPELLAPENRRYAEVIFANWLKALAAYSAPVRKAPEWVRVPPAADVEIGGSDWRPGRRLIHQLLAATDLLHRESAVMRPLRALKGGRRAGSVPQKEAPAGTSQMHHAGATK